jgi:hypothetical protein
VLWIINMSKSKLTAYELYDKIIDEVGDPGGLGIYVLRADDGGWFAEVRDGSRPLTGSGFQAAVDKIVARLRLQYDLCAYSICLPMLAENARRMARLLPPGAVRDRLFREARQIETSAHMSEGPRSP